MEVFLAIFLVVSALIWIGLNYLSKPQTTGAYAASGFVAVAIGGVLSFGFFMYALNQAFSGGGSKPKESVRYELELTFSADGKEHVFSGVYELEAGVGNTIDSGVRITGNHYGEAIPIRIPGHETLYALKLRWAAGGNQFLIADACGISSSDFKSADGTDHRAFINAMVAFEGPCELEAPVGPLFARFDDIADQKSIEIITPFQLRASDGWDGLKLERVVVKNSESPATYGGLSELLWLDQGLSWVRIIDERRLNIYVVETPGKSINLPLSSRLFKQEMSK